MSWKMMIHFLMRRLFINQTRTFKIPGSGFHELIIDDSLIKIGSYTLGSLTGGVGTESSYTIDLTRRADFFAELGIKEADELISRLDEYKEIDWEKLHKVFKKYQTDSFFWMDTDWSDSIDIEITISGETKVGATLSVVANAISTEGAFVVAYQWYRGTSIDDPFQVLQSETNENYTITETDRGKFIRCMVSASDNIGFNSTSSPSKSIGPIE
jgi:hypothetical protein